MLGCDLMQRRGCRHCCRWERSWRGEAVRPGQGSRREGRTDVCDWKAFLPAAKWGGNRRWGRSGGSPRSGWVWGDASETTLAPRGRTPGGGGGVAQDPGEGVEAAVPPPPREMFDPGSLGSAFARSLDWAAVLGLRVRLPPHPQTPLPSPSAPSGPLRPGSRTGPANFVSSAPREISNTVLSVLPLD